MLDQIDLAQEREQENREASLVAFRSHPTKEPSPNCRACGDEIPEERRAAIENCDTCVDCQRQLERRK